MRFEPKTEKEIAELNLLPKGEYDYECIDATDKTSKAGNEMIELSLRVYVGEGSRTLKDWLMEAMPGKLRNFCAQNGLLSEYETGKVCAEDCLGKSGKLYLTIQKDKSGQYPDKNSVAGYMLPKKGQAGGSAEAQGGIDDSDVPF